MGFFLVQLDASVDKDVFFIWYSHYCSSRQQQEYERVDAAHSEAAALFEEEFQSLATQLDQEFGGDSSSKCSLRIIMYH